MSEELPIVGRWASDKLERLRKYLAAYTTIMQKQRWAKGYVYVDAFAGSGRARIRESHSTDPTNDIFDLGRELRRDADARQVLDGSPRVALDIEPPFTHYVFIDRDPQRVKLLKSIEHEYKDRRKIFVRKGDCNTYLNNRLITNDKIDWRKWRGVVFLDPFGMQVPWTTIAGLARTKAMEVFLNFPVGMSIQRLLRRDGQFTPKQRGRLDEYFGDPGWFDEIYPKSPGLFGSVPSKAKDAEERLVNWYRKRLENAFGHVSKPRLVLNSHGGHLYFLIFAGPNATGAGIASYVLTAGDEV